MFLGNAQTITNAIAWNRQRLNDPNISDRDRRRYQSNVRSALVLRELVEAVTFIAEHKKAA